MMGVTSSRGGAASWMGFSLARFTSCLTWCDLTCHHAGIKLVLNSRVASVSEREVQVVNKANETASIKFGACVWATGVAMNPLLKSLQEQLPGQNHFR